MDQAFSYLKDFALEKEGLVANKLALERPSTEVLKYFEHEFKLKNTFPPQQDGISVFQDYFNETNPEDYLKPKKARAFG